MAAPHKMTREERDSRPPKPETLELACVRVPVAMVTHVLPEHYRTSLEQNQKIPSCCRHPENHDIEAYKTHPRELLPDVYILHCTCGNKHRRMCVGHGDKRASWTFLAGEAGKIGFIAEAVLAD